MDGMLRAMPYSPTTARRRMGWWARARRWWDRLWGRERPEEVYRQTSLREWQAYYRLDPFGGERGDLQAALVKQAILNTMGRGEDDDPVTVQECMPRFGESNREKKQREQEKSGQLNQKIKDVLRRF